MYWGTVSELNRVCRIRNNQDLTFDDEEVFSILDSVYLKRIPIHVIAKEYKVVPSKIEKIVDGRRYKHLRALFMKKSKLSIEDLNEKDAKWYVPNYAKKVLV